MALSRAAVPPSLSALKTRALRVGIVNRLDRFGADHGLTCRGAAIVVLVKLIEEFFDAFSSLSEVLK
jgi:hypothetical protein